MDALTHFVETSLDQPVEPAFMAMADHLRRMHAGRISAILGYGSALRGTDARSTLLDLYVLTESERDVSPNFFSSLACRLVPPNVYYAECVHDGATLRAKYAVMPLGQFAGQMTRRISNPYFWARFCQPSRLIYAVNANARRAVVSAACEALRTMYANAKGTTTETEPAAIFRAGFSQTYMAELRPESAARGISIVDANAEYFREAGRLLANELPLRAGWRWRQIAGKSLSVLRLAKAAFTFRGGVDYAAWKIARHSGQQIEITDWNRRHPLLTGLILLPRLLKRGAVR
jgi:hypothetical protein